MRYLSLERLPGLLAKLGLSMIAMLLSFQLLVAPAIAATVGDVPKLLEGDRTWVIDFADAISPSIENKVYDQLEELNQQTGCGGEVCNDQPD
jgi:uncharacterized membrane protein YgcG